MKALINENSEESDVKLRAVWMVVGEGAVFLLLLFVGLLQVIKSIKKQNQLMRQENNFLLAVTHELNSPIASIKLFLQTLTKHSLSPEMMNRLIGNVQNETQRLESTVNNILQLTKFDAAKRLHQFKPYNLNHLINEVVDSYSPEKKTRLQVQVSDTPKMINADENAIRILLSNLIDNGLKYSEPTEIVSISAIKKASSNEVRLEVADHGKGIKEKELVFSKFYREEDELTRTSKGTGLGLYLVKQIAIMHTATISVANNSPKGTVVSLDFKLLDSN